MKLQESIQRRRAAAGRGDGFVKSVPVGQPMRKPWIRFPKGAPRQTDLWPPFPRQPRRGG